MPKSAKRNKTEGFMDRVGARIREAYGALTGKRSTKGQGQGRGLRGRARVTSGRAKKTARKR